jgi:Replication-relaxation
VVQPRDVSIVADVHRYKFLTAPQLRELWWPESSVQAADRRLLKLFRAGYLDRFRPISLDRFRPISRRGSFPWTYQLGVEGHRLLQWPAPSLRGSGSCASRSTTTATWSTTCS